MIELSIRELVDSVEPLKALSNQTLRGRLSFQVARISQEVEREYQLFTEARIKIFRRYAKVNEDGSYAVDKDGNNYVEPEKIEGFQNEVTELLENNITVNVNKIALNELDDLEFTPVQMAGLMPFIEE